MKSIITFIILFAFSCSVKSQSNTSFAIGFRNHFGGLSSLNNVIRQYNDSRPWLDNKLNYQSTQNGFEIGFEKTDKNFGIAALKYFRVWNNSTAKGTLPSGENITRKVRTRVAGIELIDFWYVPITFKKAKLGGGLMPMGLGTFRVHTKLDNEKWVKSPLSDLEYLNTRGIMFKTFHPFSNLHIDYTSMVWKKDLHFQFFYTVNWFRDEYNLIYLNLAINPNSGGNLLARQKHNQNQFGFKLILNL